MAGSFKQIDHSLIHQLKLVMADVDGTLLASGDIPGPDVFDTIHRLEAIGIMVGLVSGRTLSGLEYLATELQISGPIIAENGGIAKLKVNGEVIDLGYSRQPAVEALEKLKNLFPGSIVEREDNKDRYIDIVFRSLEVSTEELKNYLEHVELLDSGYILHLMQKGISKGQTLKNLLPMIGAGNLSVTEVMVFGDSLTDLSLFEIFPLSVRIINPRLPSEHGETLDKVARYTSELFFGEGFTEVACHIIDNAFS